jgi:dihydrofolate reductase
VGKLIINLAMTVDGVIDVSDWFVASGAHDDEAWALLEGSDALFLGRKNYEGFAGYWPTQTGRWADVINPMPKYVVSRKPLGELEWNATALPGDAVENARRLKSEHDGILFVSGAGELARQLVEAGLVDELYFWIHPRIQGAGTRPYDAATIPLRLIEAKHYDTGVILLRYQPLPSSAQAGPPQTDQGSPR